MIESANLIKDVGLPVEGVRLGVADVGIGKEKRYDLLVIELAEGTNVSATFTKNRFVAAPVTIAKRHLLVGSPRALIVNSGSANAGTGIQGINAAIESCRIVSKFIGCREELVLPFSTGVIMEPLPLEQIRRGIPICIEDMKSDGWRNASTAIMTTDCSNKLFSKKIRIGRELVTVTGIAKGAGMIEPNMATMLSFVATDARIEATMLQKMTHDIVEKSFNAISVDGDTSTNDSFVLMATGKSKTLEIANDNSDAYGIVKRAIEDLCLELAKSIVRDGEGATKFITITIKDGESKEECRQVANTIARSPLVKTAFYASDPNLGRIIAAIGASGVDFDLKRVDVYLDELLVFKNGSRAQDYTEMAGKKIMERDDIEIIVCLNRGKSGTTIYTCDLSHEYVSINSDYRS